MKAYMPLYLGSIGIHSDASKTTKFMTDKYDSFTKIYNSCKEESENINSVKSVDVDDTLDPSLLSVEVDASRNTLDNIMSKIKNDTTINMKDNIIIAS